MWFDPTLVEAVSEAVPAWLAIVLVLLSYLGSVYLIVPAVIVAYWLHRDLAAPWLGGVIACYGAMSVTKAYHAGSRPTADPPVESETVPAVLVPVYEHAALIDTASFPSGHALAVTVVVGMLVVDLPVGTVRSRLVTGIAVVAVVAFTRIGLAVHYPGDVAGGIAYGLVIVALWYGVRTVAPDDATGAFAVGLALGILAVLVAGTHNSVVVLGSSIGGLLAWRAGPAMRVKAGSVALGWTAPVVAAVSVVVTWVVLTMEVGGAVFTLTWSALFVATVVTVPWLVDVRSVWERASVSPRLTWRGE